MEIVEHSKIPGVLIATPKVFEDERGYQMEVLRASVFGDEFVQSNHTHSNAGVLRGLHYHRNQADAWYVTSGELQAMLVDIRTRTDPPTVVSIDLDSSSPRVLYIPPGVAHGFLAITDVDLIYWVTNYYDGSDEYGVAWDDPTVKAPWRIEKPILSERDRSNPRLDWSSIAVSS